MISYSVGFGTSEWYGRLGLNQRPPPCQVGALTLSKTLVFPHKSHISIIQNPSNDTLMTPIFCQLNKY